MKAAVFLMILMVATSCGTNKYFVRQHKNKLFQQVQQNIYSRPSCKMDRYYENQARKPKNDWIEKIFFYYN